MRTVKKFLGQTVNGKVIKTKHEFECDELETTDCLKAEALFEAMQKIGRAKFIACENNGLDLQARAEKRASLSESKTAVRKRKVAHLEPSQFAEYQKALNAGTDNAFLDAIEEGIANE